MQTLSSGARLEIFDTLDSTSAEAKRRANAGETGPIWLLAKNQTAGYGRRGRQWKDEGGNFAATLLFEPQGNPAVFGQLSFVAGLGVIDALDKFARGDVLSLKWPNDVLALCTAKLAGLLLERIDHGGKSLLALGIGINLASVPQGLPYEAARLGDLLGAGRLLPTPQELVARLDQTFHDAYVVWRDHGMESIGPAWLERASGVGERVTARLPNETLEGIFGGIDETGALKLLQNGKTRLITAGDIMFGRVPPQD